MTPNEGPRDTDSSPSVITATLEEAAAATWPVTIYDYPDGTATTVRFLPVEPFSQTVIDEITKKPEKRYYLRMQKVALS